MELRDFLSLLRKRKWTALVVFLLTMVSAFAITEMTPIKYAAQSRVFIAVSSINEDLSTALTGSNFTLQRVKSYSQLVKTPSVLYPASEALGINIDPDSVSAKIPLDTVIIEIRATDVDPSRAARIANQVASSLGAVVLELETPLNGTTSPVKARVVETADVPQVPTQPRPLLNYALGVLLGLAAAAGVVLLRESLDTKVRSPEDIQDLTGASPMSVLPYDDRANTSPLAALSRRSSRAEGFRRARTNLQFLDVDNPPRAIVVTSSIPSEGKTTTAINLALTIALGGQRVLLIDGDLRRPKTAKYLNVDTSLGLTDVLTEATSFESAVQGFHHALIGVLPSGSIPPNPSELLGSHAMEKLIDFVKKHYDIIIIDAPPLLPVSDAAILAAQADGAIFLTRWGKVRREDARAALEQLKSVGARLLGTIVNFAPTGKRGYYYGYGYSYGYRNRYANTYEPTKSKTQGAEKS